jgi:IclR family transcriptional regulator, KDG regulon repressor
MPKKEKSDYLIQAVSHAFDLLEAFSEETPELGVTELSKRLKLHKNNVFRLLATLEAREYVAQNPITGNYGLGLRTLEMRTNYLRQAELLPQARPVMLNVAHQCNETCYVAVLKDFQCVYLDVVETASVVRIVSRVGSRLPAHCTAAGKVQLAYLDAPQLERYLATRELKRFTANTITDPEALRRHLADIAVLGYAVDDEELEAEVRGVAAPIRNYEARVVGALIASGPASRFDDARIRNELVPMLVEAAREISAKLGYSGG